MRNLIPTLLITLFVTACSSDVKIEPEPPPPPPPGDPLSSCAACSDGTRLALRPRGYSSSDGMTFRVGSTIFDKARNETCSPMLAEDNVLRCLPLAFGGANGFADPACTQKIAIVPASQLCDGPPKYIGGILAFVEACSPTKGTTLHAVGAPHAGAFFMDNSGSCVDSTANFPDHSAFLFGAKIPPEEFAAVEAIE